MTSDAMPRNTPLPTEPFYAERSDEARLVHLAFEIANRAVVEDIESYGVQAALDGRTWWDIRPMIDPNEHCQASIDMSVQAIQYAVGSGIVAVHPQRPYLLTAACYAEGSAK